MATPAILPTTVPIPTELQQFVAARVDSGDFASPEDYVSTLIQKDQNSLQEALEQRLLKAMNSETIPVPDGVLEAGQLHTFLELELKKRSLRS